MANQFKRAPYSGVVGIGFMDGQYIAAIVPPRASRMATEAIADLVEAGLNAAPLAESLAKAVLNWEKIGKLPDGGIAVDWESIVKLAERYMAAAAEVNILPGKESA